MWMEGVDNRHPIGVECAWFVSIVARCFCTIIVVVVVVVIVVVIVVVL